MTKTMTSTILALGFLMSGITATAMAQSTDSANLGSIHGTVLDPSGALIQRAEITVTNADGVSHTLKSDARGAFDVANLAAGSYTISINAAGFTPALEAVAVVTDKVTHEDVTLGISVAQEIEVDAR
ncbi:Carboxypeptidase regulatory-like domain-containing protein [Bryocella elongata]|uniref:Carboxypeptidase regulatory-like domain-containing protein n=1 Tax=Bryocella elongata TaxID=863522 RepID=A0A1H6A3W3_9BACT|nr:carboxypeptidase-like regulatory domain-containing protein [Bryocella elongata]SEG43131.1 Carboxypeptidase regulatory-like domain-containing protein [Bryocella elongata]